MIAWVYLTVAIISEVAATLSLRMAVTSRRLWLAPVVAGYLGAFALLSLALAAGMPLGVAYGVWVATGVAAVAVLGRFLFGDPFTRTMAAGVALVMAGVLLIELGATP